MKSLPVFLTIFGLALSLGAFAAPPGGQGGGRGTGGMPSPANVDRGAPTTPARTAHEQPETKTSGRAPSEILTNNTKLASQIHDLTGADAQQACSGFKNLGDCVSAAHASKNLGIGFDTLKAKVTGSGAESLGQAIHDLKPDANAKSEARNAHRQAQDDLKASGK